MADQRADIEWNGAVPVSRAFDDPYFSLEDGLAETRHVFVDGNDLGARLVPGFHVAELGFGTGLNLLALAELAWELGVEGVRYTGFEAFPMTAEEMARALEAFPGLSGRAALAGAWGRGVSFTIGGVAAEVVVGDARKMLPGWPGVADAWFLDGFAPSRNPELWEPGLLAEVARHTAPGGTAATYSAAGDVRRGLEAAGFAVERRPGFGRKRHMTVARLS
ncbi:tRNA (5-methylaminomethyl-2-thiouridine)(34)-methyltransferase MnmD [Ovoidimarina sediminis]|uniref:tRNA (5-methylaminomethyl-2-thiouridine)(34)-methyltransferase MnmD n=1 Tax=Ovoidimarina sediminis TaxID=3079856 RepID=UPI002907C1EA|nr:tRNA (5-methylaminomethyl-2-thiouridine)(34)-methyltransferase MnmD [Rhodophyticola sp. MJ-SS7]MDU8943978.1 tRNA (5-methylaminomethyl-2-thiouridine)(34)-methyltransferase MnmD [Rhodophyticola sp. MJ-SS7]